jgi:hypothetical protein
MTMNEITPANGALMSFIERAAKDDSFDVAKFGELLRLQRDVGHDQSRRLFNQAMADSQSEMLPVVRDAKNSHLGNKYAKLETIDAAMRPIYTRHGFSVRFGSAPAPTEGYIRITCTVAHAGGYFEENYLDAPIANLGSQGGRTATTGVQAVGSAVTYLRRYLLGMVFNIVLADEDDDGEGTRRAASMQRAAARTPPPERRVDPTVYDAEPATAYPNAPPNEKPERTEAAWRIFLDKLRAAVAVLHHRSEVVEIGGRATVGDALAAGPQWVQREIAAILAEAYARFPEEPGDDLDEVVIAGEENLAAG